jgi:O-antigen/teichoic acid export membrane protein
MTIFNKKKIKDFFIYGLGQAINILSPLLVLPFLINKCGIEAVGKVGVGMSIALILNGIIDYGSYINGVKDISINRNNLAVLEKKFNAIYLSKIVLFCLIFVFIVTAIVFVPYLSQDKPLFFLSLTIFIGQLINPAWFFQGVENFKWISIVNVLSKIIYLALVFCLIKQKNDYILANLFLGIGAIIANSLGLFWLMKKHSFSFRDVKLEAAIIIIKEEFSFSLSQLFLSLYQFFPIILISYFGGNLMAGQFRVIDQIISIFKTYLNMFFYFVYANICFELNKSYTNGIKVWKQYNGFNFLLLITLIAVFFYFAPFIVNYFKIDSNHIPTISKYFRIALVIPLLTAISLPLRQLMFAFNLNKMYIIFTISTTIVNFILLILFTTILGLKGVFISIIIIELIVITLYAITLMKNVKTKAIKV